ncbi:hypothetical protein PPL_03308 [Heterostelium album PN500]|uniref:Uncharacterized protein n=1 Tax=Heterostelium pallidum (strain ATCC 26659 / Pp 5 / PN500) TaxID=670386 RepID=D3B4I3_HETP5|nr:hypothetical protein PPL_03308 [Heterostelium album PN500]EFA84231.1 hypothetical protein PPL_03308 [Heterostelium album PN500]|eukprot:XP_020436347.1 hypothetical protein PPL_03308 [Heterostelium album PN500]
MGPIKFSNVYFFQKNMNRNTLSKILIVAVLFFALFACAMAEITSVDCRMANCLRIDEDFCKRRGLILQPPAPGNCCNNCIPPN